MTLDSLHILKISKTLVNRNLISDCALGDPYRIEATRAASGRDYKMRCVDVFKENRAFSNLSFDFQIQYIRYPVFVYK